jgi:SNF2 family DNA or RNA helicase
MTFTGTLLPYQPEAVDKMVARSKVLVAYDLGLGKTVLTIAAIEKLMDNGSIREPGLVICLSSLKYQWANQITKFTSGTSKPLVIDGSPKKRQEQYAEAMNWQESKVDYVIMNYEQVVNDWDLVKKLPRGFVVIDEATAIKSFRSKRSKAVKKLVNSPYRFALTGTPIENGKPEELYSIMQFVDDSVLGRFDIFDSAFIVRNHFGGVARYRNLPVLHERLAEASVRKSQKDPDVAPHMPDQIHRDPMLVPLDRKSANLYNLIRKDLLSDLEEAQQLFGKNFNVFSHYGYQGESGSSSHEENEWRGRIMSKVGALKMLCSHPDLIRTSAEKYQGHTPEGSAYANELVESGAMEGITGSKKFDVLIQYVKDHLDQAEENKVVIFATYVDMTAKIAEELSAYGARTYTGKLDAKTKEANKIALNTDPNTRILVSSDAGGYGVDLPAANLLINYDLPWTSGGANQRNGRIMRASSNWPTIVVQDILVDSSIEVRQHQALKQKNAIAAAVVDGEGINEKGGIDFTLASLNQFLLSTFV